MAKIYDSLTELVGHTPLLRLHAVERQYGLEAALLAKVEAFNPGGSAKDRVALAMIERAEAEGRLAAGAMIIEPTSGNTGVGLAWVARVKGYRAVLTMPETMSLERQRLLRAFGAELVLTPGSQGMQGAVAKAEELQRECPGSVILQQFSNPANPEAHERATAREIWDDTGGKVDVFVAGVGTGGTVSGVARGLKSRRADIKAVAVEPASSRVLATGKPGPHKIQGIGANFVPANFCREAVDEIVPVADADAMAMARTLARTEGLLVGISSGAALWAAVRVAARECNRGKTVVALLPDTGERYLSTGVFD